MVPMDGWPVTLATSSYARTASPHGCCPEDFNDVWKTAPQGYYHPKNLLNCGQLRYTLRQLSQFTLRQLRLVLLFVDFLRLWGELSGTPTYDWDRTGLNFIQTQPFTLRKRASRNTWGFSLWVIPCQNNKCLQVDHLRFSWFFLYGLDKYWTAKM